jgi:2-polyprenyl-3-methyl-5-hydroxy-6-metoxy-1,4-benzoquinol methylase
MENLKDDKGVNQIWRMTEAMKIRTERRADYIVANMNLSQGSEILEIGCGTGEISYLLAKKTAAEVLGTDLCIPFIDEARKNHILDNLRYELLDFNSPGDIAKTVGNEKFNYVVGNGILHHLYHQLDEALINIHSLLNDNGKLIFLEPNILNPYCFLIFKFPFFRKMAKLDPEEMAFTKKIITGKLARTGFKNIKVEYKDFLIPGIPTSLIKPVIAMGNIAEKIPMINKISQSIYITATKI